MITTFMVSFIISSNNSYSAMRKNAENLAVKYVENIEQEINQWDNVETNQLILLGNLQVARLEQYINRVASDGELEVVVTNSQHKVIVSNVKDYKFKQIYEWRVGGKIEKVTDKLYKYLPVGDKSVSKIGNWSNGNYIYEKAVASPALNIVVRAPIKKYQQEILNSYFEQVKLLIYFLLCALMFGLLTNRFLVRTLKQLSIATTGLPGKLSRSEDIEWPSSRVSEIKQLIDNFKHMSDNLDAMFKESREMNAILVSQAEKLQRSEERLHDLAYYDNLTKLPNRLSFKHYLTEKLREAREKGNKVAVMFIDLNQFKQINDTMGHSVGDELLKVVGSRLQRLKNSKTEVFRLGGDEFVLVLCTEDEIEVQSTAEAINRFLSEPIELKGTILSISGSIGISMFPKDGEDMDTLVKFADIAMYSSKRKGGRDIQFFSEDISRDLKGY